MCDPACVNGTCTAPDTCTCAVGWVGPTCAQSVCGDGIIVGAEECDDSNPDDGDGCSSSCLVEAGFQCVGEPSICGLIACGACQLYGDVFPFDPMNPNFGLGGVNIGNCAVDVDDLLVTLGAFAVSPNATTSTGGPWPDNVDMFPCGGAGAVVDIDDVVAVLGAFAGIYACPHVCSPGACCGNLSDNNGNAATCLDWDQQPPEQTPPGGMSLNACVEAGGTYQGDGTTCADVACP